MTKSSAAFLISPTLPSSCEAQDNVALLFLWVSPVSNLEEWGILYLTCQLENSNKLLEPYSQFHQWFLACHSYGTMPVWLQTIQGQARLCLGKFDLLWREPLGKILAREKIAQLLLSRIEATRLPGVRGGTSDEAATWLVRRICLGLWAPPPCA